MLQRIFNSFGTTNMITIYDSGDVAVLDAIEQMLKKMNDHWSVFCENSDVCRINKNAGQQYSKVHADTYDIIKESVRYSQLTNGTFDITIQPLIDRWNLKKHVNVPERYEINKLLSRVDYRNILLQKKNHMVMLKKEQAISLGAIAKGYVVNVVKDLLRQYQIKDAVINLGGTVLVKGAVRKVGLQHPKEKTGTSMGELSVQNQIVVTSGSYEHWHVRDGVQYHHLLDPRTGYPSDSHLLSVTLVGEDGALLDVLATTIFILGIEKGYEYVTNNHLQAVFVTDQLEVMATDGLQKQLKLYL